MSAHTQSSVAILMKVHSSVPRPSLLENTTKSDPASKASTVCLLHFQGQCQQDYILLPITAKTLPLLPQNYTHLTLLKSSLSRDERGGRPQGLHSVNTQQSTSWLKSHIS